jgi:hypothetical protein
MRRRVCLLLVPFLLARIDVAIACSFALPSVEKLYAGASAVFVGALISVEEAGVVSAGELPPRIAVEATFRVIEVLKGDPPANGKIRAPTFEACGPVLLVGWEYVFFLYEDNFIRSWEGALPVVWSEERERYLGKLQISKEEQK